MGAIGGECRQPHHPEDPAGLGPSGGARHRSGPARRDRRHDFRRRHAVPRDSRRYRRRRPRPANQHAFEPAFPGVNMTANRPKKVVLAYSGGLDTSIILKWLQTEYQAEVVTFTADLGQGEEV